MNKLKIILAIILLISLNKLAPAQPVMKKYAPKIKLEVQANMVIDISFEAKHVLADNAFDVLFGAKASLNNELSTSLSGFYNGGNEWVLRFSANTCGMYEIKTFSSEPALSGQSFTVNVLPNSIKHGGVTINPKNPQYFVYQDSTPYFALAYELDWLFALDYNSRNGIPKTKQLIQSIKENGFNQLVMNVYAYDVQWPTEQNIPAEYEYRRPSFFPFKGSNEKPDYSALKIDFFKNFDRVIQHLDEQGIISHLMIYVWNKKVAWPNMYSKADNMYFDYVIARYQAFANIIWDVSKEALDYGRCDMAYINERISRIRKNDNFKRLITVHDYEYCSRQPDMVDFISIQSWRSGIYFHMIDVRNKHLNKPVMNIEHGGYESGPYMSFKGNYANPEKCLIRNYECIFAGVYSTYYWQNTSWNIIVYNPFNNNYGFEPPRFDYYKHLSGLFSRYSFNQLFPSKSKLTTNGREGFENLSTCGYALTNGKNLFLFLVPSEADRINTILPKPQSGKINVTWFNPFTGEYINKGTVNWAGWQEFTSPWPKYSSVLIIEY